ncbi:Imm21 family immunity protein [Streptomyces sp. NBC_00872]|uniref:Imm21 family immunity protein n=1 Tax=Streptomyces sp. NBC_00872 TaxID=2903686 RepID=UPI0038677289|nr:immunity 21 family protein [Streptomyces sp. NBC_00872]
MNESRDAGRHVHADPSWVRSMGGPLIVVPASALDRWSGCTEDGVILGGTAVSDDYDRACDVEGWAGVISVGTGAAALVLADEPATTRYLPEQRVFLRRLAADSEAELLEAAGAVLDDPATDWEDCGIWETDGAAVLMDSAEAGADLAVEYPDRGGLPEQAAIPVPAGRWSVRAFHKTGEFPWVGVVQLLPAERPSMDSDRFTRTRSPG